MIQVENLTKTFKRQKRKLGLWGAVQSLFDREYEYFTAVDSISFEINKGEMVAYIGPNGAGKSTTIKMMVGILVPTSGQVRVNRMVAHQNRIENAKRIGVVFGQRTQLWWDIPVSESFSLLKRIYDIPEKQYRENLDIFSEILDLPAFFNVPVRQLSLGQRMRADLAASLLHNPEILFLDEPTIGLDVVVKEKIREFIKVINQSQQTTVILTTHDISDIEKLCSRIIVIDQGHLMFDDSLAQLKRSFVNEEIMSLEIETDFIDLEGLKGLGVDILYHEQLRIRIKYSREQISSANILKWFMERCVVRHFDVEGIETEEVIRKMYNQNKMSKSLQEWSEE